VPPTYARADYRTYRNPGFTLAATSCDPFNYDDFYLRAPPGSSCQPIMTHNPGATCKTIPNCSLNLDSYLRVLPGSSCR
jgi:hypothetical protein